jgi:hypothetical protein
VFQKKKEKKKKRKKHASLFFSGAKKFIHKLFIPSPSTLLVMMAFAAIVV